MDARLKLILSTLPDRLSDKGFMELRLRVVNKGPELTAELTSVWGSDDFLWKQGKGKGINLSRDAVMPTIEKVVGDAAEVKVLLVERTTETTIEFRGGKVTTKMGARKVSAAPATEHVHEVIASGTRQSFIKAHEASAMLEAIGVMAADGEIKGDKRRKFYQIDRFIELVVNMLVAWPDKEELVVLDCGCGKSYLSFALNYYLYEKLGKRCYFIGIDNNSQVIESSREVQRKLNYRNMEFVATDVRSFQAGKKVNMVLSLHACDTATDQALALGLRCGAKYIIAVPCCQTSLTDEIDYGPFANLARHNVFKKKLADLLTDGLRTAALEAHGYKVSVAEYVSPLDTPKNIMIRAEKSASAPNPAHYDEFKRMLNVTPWIDRLL
ncbi:MAG: methylase involved in ubiquinone/menaquinone biosynthesi [Bacillota bacterium]|nr:MAG: methylase involved in ubiquinone/menaquinone biosynthesi [Bacillota bacterium]